MSIRVPITAAIGALAIATATAYAVFGHTTAQQHITTGTISPAEILTSNQPSGASGSTTLTWMLSSSSNLQTQRVMTASSENGTYSAGPFLNPTATTTTFSAPYNADRYFKIRSIRRSWFTDSAIWSSHSLPMASGTDRVSGTGSGTAFTGPWTTAGTNLAALATADGTRYEPPTWPFNIYQNTGFSLDLSLIHI